MPKNIYTPRDELICGKIDEAEEIACALSNVRLVDLLREIRHDAERMEQGLIRRKYEATPEKSYQDMCIKDIQADLEGEDGY